MVELFVMEYMTVLGMTVLLLFLDSRYFRRCTVLTVCSTMVLAMAAIIVLYREAGVDTTLRVYTLVIHIPLLLLAYTASRFRGWRPLFQMLSTVLFCTLIHHMAGVIYYLSGGRFWVLALSYAVLSAGVIWFLLRLLRPLFLQVLAELRRGWWLICLVLALYYAIVIHLIPGYVGFDRSSTIIKPAIALLMVGVYSIMIFLFTSVRKEAEARHSAQMSALRLSAFQSRMEAVKAAEEVIRTERHDLRHRLQAAAELVARGDRETALAFLDAAQKRLEEKKEIRWCRPPVLDAVFSSYFDQAENQGIPVEAEITLPGKLPADEGELAIVLANALENAIHANLKLPRERRMIRCRMVGAPGIMLEVSNPCGERVVFDAQGLPSAQQEGHGQGVRSISAFCRKNGAVCQYELTGGWFRLRLIL